MKRLVAVLSAVSMVLCASCATTANPTAGTAEFVSSQGSDVSAVTDASIPDGTASVGTESNISEPDWSLQSDSPPDASVSDESASEALSSEGGTESGETTKAEKILAGMTLKEKICQLFIIRPEALQIDVSAGRTDPSAKNGVKELSGIMKNALKAYPVGGIAFFGQNISAPEQLTSFISAMQYNSKIALFTAVDEEGGSVARIANSPNFNVTRFDDMQTIGNSGDPENARNVGVTIGTYLKGYGFNLNFAPVSDVNTNPDNIVIGKRAFGSDPHLVANMIASEIDGLHDAGVMSCVKHFPGHGDTKGDTHNGFVSTEKTWDELKECELIPFIRAVEASVDMVMAAHITLPNITSDGLPSSISYEVITEKLRNELNYQGVVITDAMEMGAITQKYSSGEGAVKAVSAGADIILMPLDFAEAYNGVYEAVSDGTISEKRIDESVLRILKLKEKYGLLK
jgi:beta-N-acetylhexosaminidase